MNIIIKKIAADLANNPNVNAVYLFGSRATGKAGPLSDIDICVITSRITEYQKNDILGHGFENIDIVLFDDLPITIKYRIFSEGKAVYVRDIKSIDTLAWRTIKEYWDFKPILKEFIEQYLPGVTYV